jgi:hypothetical protein
MVNLVIYTHKRGVEVRVFKTKELADDYVSNLVNEYAQDFQINTNNEDPLDLACKWSELTGGEENIDWDEYPILEKV